MRTNIQNLNFNEIMEEFKKALRDNGLKYTKQREVLLEILYIYHLLLS